MNKKSFFAGIIAFFLIASSFAPSGAHTGKLSLDRQPIPSSINMDNKSEYLVDINNSGFDPVEITIEAGDSITWTNQTLESVTLVDGIIFHVYLPLLLKPGLLPGGLADNSPNWSTKGEEIILAGGIYTRVFPTPGVFHFYLKENPGSQFTVTVTAKADLEVRTISLDPNPAAQNSTVDLSTEIYNLGLEDAENFSVSWKLLPLGQTTPVVSGSWDVSSLGAGQHTTLATTFTALQPGPFTIQVIADPDSSLPDADLTNNIKEVEMGVTGGLNFCGDISTDTRWAYATYVITCNININSGATLTISSGTIVKFQNGISMIVNGSLVSEGTELSPVIFTSFQDDTAGGDTNNDGSASSPASGDWNSLIVATGGTVDLDHTSIRYGGYYWCGVNCHGDNTPLHVYNGGIVMLDHATMNHNGGYGIYVNPSSTSQLTVSHSTIESSTLSGIKADGIAGNAITITDNIFSGNGAAAVSLAFSGGSVTALNGNSGSGNVVNGIQLSGTLGMDTTLPGNPVFAYEVSGGLNVDVGKTLTLSPDAVVKFGGSGEALTINGSLITNGTELSPVIFTSFQDDTAGGDTNNDGSASSPVSGDWNSLIVAAEGTVDLVYTSIQYGGWYWCGVNCYGENTPLHVYNGGIVMLDHATMNHNGGNGIYVNPSSTSQLTVSHSTIETSAMSGIKADGIAGNAITISDNVFSGNGAAAASLAFSGGSVTALDGNSGSGNVVNGIQLSGTLGMDTTLPGNPVFAYVVSGGLTVDAGKILTLSSETVVKFGATGEILTINGSLITNGTELFPVIFTSLQDDTAGGDTNNDGSASSPFSGDWNSLIVATGGTANFTHTSIQYGGWYWCGVNCYGENTSLHAYNGGIVMLDHVTMSHSGGNGIYVNPSSISQLTVSHSTIESSTLSGIKADGIAGNAITITDNIFSGNGAAAVSLTFSGGSVTALDGNSGSGNGVNGIQLSGTLGMDTTLPGNPVFAYEVSGGLTVDAGKILTLSPDAVVKFGGSGETLTINGSLITNGTELSPVIFTSFQDDTVGGDTNNNGSTSSPARGDWNSIIVTSGGTANFTHTSIQYGGWYWCGVNCYGNNIALWLQESASANLQFSTVRDSNGLAISATGNSDTTSLTITDSAIVDNNSNGINIANYGTYILSVSRTIIRNNSTGINLTDAISAVVNHCNIYNNASLGINNLTPTVIDATLNWWGSDTGPSPIGTGNGVSTNVNVTPWLTAPEDLP